MAQTEHVQIALHVNGDVTFADQRGAGTSRVAATGEVGFLEHGLRATGLRPNFLQKFEKRGVALPLGLFQGREPELGSAAIAGTAGR